MEITITGALESPVDSRTVELSLDKASTPYITGGKDYLPTDIENQSRVGICTAISLVQNREKTNGKKYSADFQYLLQKKFYDFNWIEGSCILSALKVGKKYGFLPADKWTYTTQEDRLSYSIYIAKLQAISDKEIQSLISQCIDNIPGYASVDVTDTQKIAKAITESEAGILCRYSVGSEWYTSVNGVISWDPNDINPIRPPKVVQGGHAIINNKFDFSSEKMQTVANTWSPLWCKNGQADIIWDQYKPTEAWTILTSSPEIPVFNFKNNLSIGMTSPDIKQLQIFLNKNPKTQVATSGAGSLGHETNYFGTLTFKSVKIYQALNGIPQTGFVGPLTRNALNKAIS